MLKNRGGSASHEKLRSPGVRPMSSRGFAASDEMPLARPAAKVAAGASVLSCCATLSNTILGTGILELPHAFAASGFVLGPLLLTFFAASAAFTLHLLSVSARTVLGVDPQTGLLKSAEDDEGSLVLGQSGALSSPRGDDDSASALLLEEAPERPPTPPPASFYLVANAAVPGFAFLIDLAVVVKCFGVSVSYLVVVGDMMPDAVEHMLGRGGVWATDRLVWVFLGWLVVAPLTFFRRLDALSYTSTFAVAVVVGVSIMVVLFALVPALGACREDFPQSMADADPSGEEGSAGSAAGADCHGETAVLPYSAHATLASLTLFIFGFTCHQNIFTICNEIRDNTERRVNAVIGISVALCYALCMAVGLAGYATYGDTLMPEDATNVLTHYPSGACTTLARVCLTLLVLFSYPLQAHPSRNSAMSILCALAKRPLDERERRLCFVGFTVAFLVAGMAIASVTTSLGKVMAVVGATGSTTVAFILPGAVYYRLHPRPHLKRYAALLILLMGCGIIPLALTFIFT